MSSADDVIVESFKIKRMRAAADLFLETLINYHCIEDKAVFDILKQEAEKHGYILIGTIITFVPNLTDEDKGLPHREEPIGG